MRSHTSSPSMARSELSSDRPVLSVVNERINNYEKMPKEKLPVPIVQALIKELVELKSNFISALAEEPNQTMAASVLRVFSRRIKKYQKKSDRVARVEKSQTLKKEQEELLLSKPIVSALRKELRELTWPLISALTKELRQICEKKNQFDAFTNTDDPIEELLRWVNLASLLDVKSLSDLPSAMLMGRYDKGLMYDYLTGKEVQLLSENDKNLILLLGSLVTSQPDDAGYGSLPSDSTKVDTVRSKDEKIYHSAYLKKGGGSKRKGKMKTCAKKKSSKTKNSFARFCCTTDSCQSGASEWMMGWASSHWDSLNQTDKQNFLAVPASELDQYCALLGSSWQKVLSEAVLFYKLHGTWEIYICPKPGCFHWFKEDKSLIGHLKSDHFPIFHGINRWPSPKDIAAEERCVDTLCKMVWKPIHLQSTLDLLSRIHLDHTCVSKAEVCGGCDRLCSLEWPLCEDPARSELLEKLRKKFKVLIAKEKEASYAMLSRGYLTKMTVLAFENIVTHLDPSDRVLFLGCTLAHSPLIFCFLGEKALSSFVSLVSKMCHLVKQVAACSQKRKLDPNKSDVDSNNSERQDAVSFSVDHDCFLLDPAKTIALCYGQKSIPSWLCSAPCCPSITQVPAEASEVFEKIEDKLFSYMRGVSAVKSRFSALISEKQWTSFRYPWLQSDFKSEPLELDQLRLECELESLEPQVHYLCAFDLRNYILPLMRSFLRKRLYKLCRELEAAELVKNCAEIPTEGSSLEDLTKEKVDSDEDKAEDVPEEYSDDGDSAETTSEENSDVWESVEAIPEEYYDCETQSDAEETLRAKKPSFTSIDSTLTESLGEAYKNSGTFFLIPISDILGQSEQARLPSRLNKSWKYLCCYCCNKAVLDHESYMVHMEHEHQLGLTCDNSWLVPFPMKKIANFSHVGMKDASGVEEVITLDRINNYFLVDIRKFYEFQVSYSEESGLTKPDKFINELRNEIRDIKCLLSAKSKHLRSLEVVHCLHEILFNGDHSLALLVTWLYKLYSSKSHLGTSHLFQLEFLCQVLEQAQAPLSHDTVNTAFAKMQHDLITKLHDLDQRIEDLIVQKNNSWRHLSDLSVCDYRMAILSSVRPFIHETCGIDGNVFSSTCDKIKTVLSYLGSFGLLGEAHNLSVEVLPGKVLIHRMKTESGWSYAFIGFVLNFVGEWSVRDQRESISGSFSFDASLDWYRGGTGVKGKVSLDIKHNTSEYIDLFKRNLEEALHVAVAERLSLLQL